MSAADYGSGERRSVDQLNAELRAEVERIEEEDSAGIYRFGDILKEMEVKEVRPGRIVLGNLVTEDEQFDLGHISNSLNSLKTDYEDCDITQAFHTKFNRKNPYRIDVVLEKEDATEGVMVYAFGKWVITPYMPEDSFLGSIPRYSFLGKKALHIQNPPRHASVAYRPEKSTINDYVLSFLENEYGYKTKHLRFANDFPKPPYASLVLSHYAPTEFTYQGEKDEILPKWGLLIPGLKESFT